MLLSLQPTQVDDTEETLNMESRTEGRLSNYLISERLVGLECTVTVVQIRPHT